MKEYYLVKKFNKVISINKENEIVTRMREFDWNNESNNRDYMHVYAFWKKQKSDISIRYEKENEFVEDLFKYRQIEKVSYLDYLAKQLYRKLKSLSKFTFS